MFRKHLGIAGSVRCIVSGDGEDEVYVQDVVGVIRCLDMQHPVGAYVVQVCQGFKDVHGCGVKSLLFMVGQLSKEVQLLLEQGVPLVFIEDLLHEAVEECIHDLGSFVLPVTLSSAPRLLPLKSSPPAARCTSQLSQHASDLSSSSPFSETGCLSQLKKPTSSFANSEQSNTLDSFLCQLKKPTSSLANNEQSKTFDSFLRQLKKPTSSLANDEQSKTLDSFLRQLQKPTMSATLHKRVMVSSRHFVHGDSDAGDVTTDVRKEAYRDFDDGVAENDSICYEQAETANSHSDKVSSVSTPRESIIKNKTCLSSRFQGSGNDASVVGRREICQPEERSDKVSSASPSPESISADDKTCLSRRFQSGGNDRSAVEKRREVCLPGEAQFLSHNHDDMMPWARAAMQHQLLHSGLSKFDINLVHASSLSGPHGSHRLLRGVLVPADLDAMVTVSRMEGPVAVLLVNGDLTAGYKHKGHRAALSTTPVTTARDVLNHPPPHQSWHHQVIALLQKLAVRVVLVRGVVCSDLRDASEAAGVALVGQVPMSALRVLQTAGSVDCVTYVMDAHQGNVCGGIHLQPLQDDWCDSLQSHHKHLVITAPVFIQTLVLRSPSAAGRELLQESFWHCAARLAHAAQDGKVLMGGGATEQHCAHLLTASKAEKEETDERWGSELSLYRGVVRRSLADAFQAYSRTVQQNRHRAGHDVEPACPTAPVTSPVVIGSSRNRNLKNHEENPSEPTCGLETKKVDVQPACPVPVASLVGSSRNCNLQNHKENFGEPTCALDTEDLEANRSMLLSPSSCSYDGDDQEKHSIQEHVNRSIQDHRNNSGLDNPNHNIQDQKKHMVQDHRNQDHKQYCLQDHQNHSFHGHCIQNRQNDTIHDHINLSFWDHGSSTILGNTEYKNVRWAVSDECETVAVFDNYGSKVEGWRTAVQCVCTVMRMDSVITTGLDPLSLPSNSLLL